MSNEYKCIACAATFNRDENPPEEDGAGNLLCPECDGDADVPKAYVNHLLSEIARLIREKVALEAENARLRSVVEPLEKLLAENGDYGILLEKRPGYVVTVRGLEAAGTTLAEAVGRAAEGTK